MRRLTVLSSTTSAVTCCPGASRANSVGCESSDSSPDPASSARTSGSVKWKRLPSPTVLSTLRSAPMLRSRWRLIVRPSPVPPAAAPLSVCVNASKILSSSSGSMPGPVSRTSKVS